MPSQKKIEAKEPDHKTNFYIIIGVVLILGVIIGALATMTTIKQTPSLIQTYCEIDMQTLYEKPCETTEDCYGRLELCSKQYKTCMTTVIIDKNDIRNIRIPDNQPECEANGGIWKVEYITED